MLAAVDPAAFPDEPLTAPQRPSRVRNALRHPERSGALLALLIGYASVFSAVLAWQASVANIDASRFQSLAVQQQARREQIERELEGTVEQDQRFITDYQEHALDARQIQAQADSIRSTDSDAADALDVQAQSEAALARALEPFFTGASGIALDANGNVPYDTAFVLRSLQDADPELRELQTSTVGDQANAANDKAIQLTAIAALVVAALFFLTVAEVAPDTAPDPSGVLCRGWRDGSRRDAVVRVHRGRRVSGGAPATVPVAPGRDARSEEQRLAGIVAIIIALRHARRSLRRLPPGRCLEPGQQPARSGRTTVTAGARELTERATERPGQPPDVPALHRRAHPVGQRAARRRLRGRGRQHRAAAGAPARVGPLGIDRGLDAASDEHRPAGDFGPDKDPTFPRRYFANATADSLRLNALVDAADEEAANTDQRSSAYTAILATLAVSLYLFGLTLAVNGRWLRYGFLTVGLVLMGFGTLWLAQVALTPAFVTNDEAASAYANGRVAELTAVDAAGFKAAEDDFSKAIQLRPTFARAYADRATVIFEGASPQRTGYISIVPVDALRRARADLESARALGLANAQTYGDLGFYTFSEAIQSNDLNLFNQSVTYSQQAIALDPGEPVYRYNLGVALAAAGRFDDARNAYSDAVARTLFVDDALSVPRGAPGTEESVLGGALTDLETVRKYRPDLDSQVQAIKEQIVGKVASETKDAPQQSPATFSDLQLERLSGRGPMAGHTGELRRDARHRHCPVVPPGSAGAGLGRDPRGLDGLRPSQGADGRYFVLAPYLSQVSPPQCLPSGQYKVEIYINGRRAAEGDCPVGLPRLPGVPGARPHVCVLPPARLGPNDRRHPGPDRRLHQSAMGTMASTSARYGIPGSLRNLPDVSASMEDLTVNAFSDLFPAQPTYDETSGTTSDYFEGLTETAWRWYDYGTGSSRWVPA